MPNGTTIACYYFPNYHVDPNNENQHGPGWTEWELARRAEPRFPGHRQPTIPAWGYEDESDPAVMARKISAAADHGLDVFIFDWYWFDEGPFLERGLENGFLKAPNCSRLKFALMWANENWVDAHPTKLSRLRPVLFNGQITPATWERLVETVIERYFRHPSYWTIAGGPFFSFFELMPFIAGCGSVAAARQALDHFRKLVKDAGFPGLHLNAVDFALRLRPEGIASAPALVKALGLDSCTSYCWAHNGQMTSFPAYPYRDLMKQVITHWDRMSRELSVPYYPNVTMGWDPSPRTAPSDKYINRGHPFGPILVGNTPGAFREGLSAAREFMEKRPVTERILTINAWNEWTEGSYLEPDTVYGLQYLEAVKSVFSCASN